MKHPKVQRSFLDLGMIRDIAVDGDTVRLTLALKSERSPLRRGMENQIDSALRSLPGVNHVHMEVTEMSREEWEKIFPPPVYQGIARVKQVVAVASGKGGVGKTTVAVNVALALAAQGLRVGLMDADIYGPLIPIMLDLTGTPEPLQDGMIKPYEKYGLKIMSPSGTACQRTRQRLSSYSEMCRSELCCVEPKLTGAGVGFFAGLNFFLAGNNFPLDFVQCLIMFCA